MSDADFWKEQAKRYERMNGEQKEKFGEIIRVQNDRIAALEAEIAVLKGKESKKMIKPTVDLEFILKECGNDIKAAQRRIDRAIADLWTANQEWQRLYDEDAAVSELQERIAALEAEFGRWKMVQPKNLEDYLDLMKECDALKAEVERLRAALEKIACFNDTAIHLDEPVSATIAREALK